LPTDLVFERRKYSRSFIGEIQVVKMDDVRLVYQLTLFSNLTSIQGVTNNLFKLV